MKKSAKDLAHERECQKLRTRVNKAETAAFLTEKENAELKDKVNQLKQIIKDQEAIIHNLKELLGLSDEEIKLLINKEKAATRVNELFSVMQSISSY